MQRIAVTVRLNRISLQFDEGAYARLEAYFAEARRALEDYPDRAEILGDLEEAVADQCMKRMHSDQSIVTLAELHPALEEIGIVQVPGGTASAEESRRSSARPLQQVSEGALISGVCLGMARYFQLDVTLLRVIAVLLLFVSGGGMILVYLILMLLLPFAPAEPGSEPIRKIPAKSRELVGFLRSKLSAVTS